MLQLFLQPFQSFTACDVLVKTHTDPHIKTVTVLALPDQLEVDTAVTIQKSSDIRCSRCVDALAFPRYYPGSVRNCRRAPPI